MSAAEVPLPVVRVVLVGWLRDSSGGGLPHHMTLKREGDTRDKVRIGGGCEKPALAGPIAIESMNEKPLGSCGTISVRHVADEAPKDDAI